MTFLESNMLTPALLEKLLGETNPQGFHLLLVNGASDEPTDLSALEDRQEMDTLGNLIDKLATVNAKLWHNQEVLYEAKRMTSEQFERRYGGDLASLHKIIIKTCDLNLQRARLMDEIDKFLVEGLKMDPASAERLLRPQNKIC